MAIRLAPPWLNRSLNAKLARKRRLKAKGIAPVPASKSAQRALAESVCRADAELPEARFDNAVDMLGLAQ